MRKNAVRNRRNGRKPERSAQWIALGAMGGLVAYSSTAGPAVKPSYGGQIRLNPSINLLTQNTPTHRFDIPEGTIGDAIGAFRKTTGLRVAMGRSGLEGLPSPGLRGQYTAERGLRQLLAGSGLAYRYTASDEVTLDLQRLSTAIDVSTSAPGTAVSSARYTETLREIPQTIEVIPQAVLQEQGAVTLSDALRNVPGITMQAGEGGGASNTRGDMFNLRGFNASNSLFVDGVRDDGLISRNVYNLEQVEVYLGPTGSDVGRGTASGYVNMQTKTANLRPGYSGTIAYASADQKRGSIDLNQPLRLGPAGSWLARAAARLNAMWQQGGVPGRDLVELKNRAIAPTVSLGLGTPTRATFSSEFVRQDDVPDYGVPGAAWASEPLRDITVRAENPVRQSNYYGSIDYDYDDVSRDSFTGRVEHDVSDNLTLRFQARYNETHRDAIVTGIGSFDPGTQSVSLQRRGNERRNRIVSNQSNLVARFATGTVAHALTGGIEYAYEDQFAPGITGVGDRGPIDIYNPDPREPLIGYAPSHSGAYTKGWTNTVSAYAFDTIDFGRRWQFTGGVRWEQFATNFRSVNTSLIATTDQRASDTLLSGKAGLLFRITDRGNAYFSYGTSLTPPGTANFSLSNNLSNQNNPNVEPQESRNYEAGAKWDFFRSRLLVNFAAFHTENKNAIFTVDASAVPPIFNQDDEQRVNGFTIGGIGQIGDSIQLIANYSYMDAKRITQNPAQNGNRLQLTPRHSGSLWTTYRMPFGLNIGGGFRYTDIVFVNTANTIKVPAYYVVDAMAEYPVNANFTLRVNVYNVTDETYVLSVNNNGNRYNPGNPRSAMITTAFRF